MRCLSNVKQWGVMWSFKHFMLHRHGKGIQLAFIDGSARRSRARHLWRLPWHNSFDVTDADRQAANFIPAWMQ